MTTTTHARPARGLAVLAPLAVLTLAPVCAQAEGEPSSRLEPVIVTASRTAQPLATVLADVSVLSRTDIERSGATSVADVLARLPGVEFARNGGPGTATSVFIRGAEARHTAVYIDGLRVDSQSTGGAVWEQLPLDQIERIEVLRGPAAAVYGSDAVAGVVQLFTRRGQGAARPTAALTLGSFNSAQASAGISGSAAELDYALSAAHSRSDGFDARTRTAPASSHNPDDDGYQRNSVQARLGYQLSREHRLEATALSSHLRSGYDSSATADDENRHTLRSASLAWAGRWSDAASTRVQVGETRSTYETQPSFYRTETKLRDTTLQHEWRVGSQVWNGILERREDQLHNPSRTAGAILNGERHQDGVALGWRGDFGAHGLQAQVRHDQDSEFGGKRTGSVAWGWAFVPQWRLSASAATSFRAPTLYQRYSVYGNADLAPERGRNVELGLRWVAGASNASLTAWRNKVDQLITFGAAGVCASTYGCYRNVGHAQLKGVTLAGRTALAGVALHGSLDWHDPRNLDTDKVLQRRARRLATLGGETEVAGWMLGSEVQAAGVRYDNAANTQALGGYALLSVYLSKAITPALTLEARVDNLADKHYELARTYATAGRNGQVSLRWAGL